MAFLVFEIMFWYIDTEESADFSVSMLSVWK